LTRRDLRVQERSIGHKGLKIRSPNMEGGRESRRASVANIVLVVLGALGSSPLAWRVVETR
jgi:hypothetical protein